MKQIELREVAITDLSLKFARDMGNNKVRHYRISAIDTVVGRITGLDVEQMIATFIAQTEPDAKDSEIRFLYTPRRENNTLFIQDVTKKVLKGERGVKRALKKKYIKRMIHEYNRYDGYFDALKDRLQIQWNKFFKESWEWDHAGFFSKMPYRRVISPVSYLSVAFEKEQYNEAVIALREDLKILHKHGLIMGHLAMPSEILLADTIGLGKEPMALFCFLHLDWDKLHKVLGTTPMTIEKLPLAKLGVKYEQFEGSLKCLRNIPFEEKYEIEIVDVSLHNADAARAAHIQAFEESKELINAIADEQRQLLRSGKIVSESIQLGEASDNAFQVRVGIKEEAKE